MSKLCHWTPKIKGRRCPFTGIKRKGIFAFYYHKQGHTVQTYKPTHTPYLIDTHRKYMNQHRQSGYTHALNLTHECTQVNLHAQTHLKDL